MANTAQVPASSRRRHYLILAILVVLVVAAGAWWRWGGTTKPVAQASAAPPPVSVSHPLQKEITEFDEYTGQFAAVESVEIRARVSGYLTEIHFQDGQTVKKGDLLFVIDPRPFQAAVDLAEANLERDKAQTVRADLDLKRYADLSQKQFASQQQFETTRATAAGAAATVKADEAQLATAKLNLEFTHITAPVAGRASSHEVSLGNLVIGGDSGQTTLLVTIVSLDPIYLNFDTSETEYLRYRRAILAGQLKSPRQGPVPVQAQLADEHSWPHDGNLDFVDNQFNRGAGTLRVRGIFPNPDLVMSPGQFGRVRVPASDPHPAILVPDTAIVADQSRKIVLTVKEDGTVEPRPIQIGPTYQGLRVVRGGLSATDTIIIDGVMRARPGSKVTPQTGTVALDPEAR
ncbi:MAG TPA: efflux RND transporter periplasmic adaptor subunit [Aliidongia sp.]|nr:efflux RND transporter periplasmic adaptor subunit [Aliidongia sp.]